MKSNWFSSVIFPILFCLAIACSSKKESSKETVNVPTEKSQSFQSYQDSVLSAWNLMIESDNKKIKLVKRLIEEISYTPQPDPVKINQAKALQSTILAKRYTIASLENASAIDRYDASTDTLLRTVYQLVSITPNLERYPLVTELVGDINAIDNQVVIMRANYDRWAKQYNAYLQNHLSEVQQLYPDCTAIKPLGLFEISE